MTTALRCNFPEPPRSVGTMSVYRIGETTPIHVSHAHGGVGWKECAADLAWHFDCDADDIGAPDVYWGGEYGEDNSADVIVINGVLVASFDTPLTAEQVAAIYANDGNSHAKLGVRK